MYVSHKPSLRFCIHFGLALLFVRKRSREQKRSPKYSSEREYFEARYGIIYARVCRPVPTFHVAHPPDDAFFAKYIPDIGHNVKGLQDL
jgi:hypothetical protein